MEIPPLGLQECYYLFMLPLLDALRREEIERAILKTIVYSDLFDYPLTPGEVAHYLADNAVSGEQVQAALSAPLWIGGQIAKVDGYVTLRGRESLVNRRRERAAASRRLWRIARLYARLLGLMPFVRMVAVTGALAMDNSDSRDDVDVFLVTAPDRVWLARAFAVGIVYAGKLTGAVLCPNYVLSQDVLTLEPPSVYVAHEFVQMVPIFGLDIYRRMRAANPWAELYLPNAGRPLHEEPEYRPGWLIRTLKRAAEWLLSGRLGDRLESWEMRRKIRKFTRESARWGGSVILDRDQVKGHFDDHGTRISRRYESMLEAHQLTIPHCSHAARDNDAVANLP